MKYMKNMNIAFFIVQKMNSILGKNVFLIVDTVFFQCISTQDSREPLRYGCPSSSRLPGGQADTTPGRHNAARARLAKQMKSPQP